MHRRREAGVAGAAAGEEGGAVGAIAAVAAVASMAAGAKEGDVGGVKITAMSGRERNGPRKWCAGSPWRREHSAAVTAGSGPSRARPCICCSASGP
jgi:hypothetical protein